MTVKKNQVVMLVLLFILSVLLIGSGYFLRAYGASRSSEPIEYPVGYTNDDIFTQQNTSYTASGNFSATYWFPDTECYIDVLSASYAYVGDDGVVYLVNKDRGSYQYVTYGEGGSDDLLEKIADELPYAEFSLADTSLSRLELLYAESGYINGYRTDYLVFSLTCSNGSSSSTLYVCGYAIYVDDNYYFEGISVNSLSEDNLILLRDLAYEDFFTFRVIPVEVEE